MKRIISIAAALSWALVSFAQTPQEIVSRMESVLDKHQNDGVKMYIDIKIPIIGTLTTKSYALGDKYYIDADAKGTRVCTWSDGKTDGHIRPRITRLRSPAWIRTRNPNQRVTRNCSPA